MKKKIEDKRPIIPPEHLIVSASEDQGVDQHQLSVSDGEDKEEEKKEATSAFQSIFSEKLKKKQLVSPFFYSLFIVISNLPVVNMREIFPLY